MNDAAREIVEAGDAGEDQYARHPQFASHCDVGEKAISHYRGGVGPAASAIVGDRLLTDVAMAGELGMSSVLVLTGVTSLDDLARSVIHPDFVARSLLDLLPTRLDRG